MVEERRAEKHLPPSENTQVITPLVLVPLWSWVMPCFDLI
jgi:hypothetical protein